MAEKKHSRWTLFWICLIVGYLGVHRFMVGKTGTGILYLLTGGLAGIGYLVDIFMLLFGSFRDSNGNLIR
ncbi:MAG: TM2 domain-containing protein [Clostridia bacterium]|nr:TM2 domain-containing protein [Clostridia bacterium]